MTVVDAASPTDGVLISASAQGGETPATVSIEGSSSILSLDAGDQVIATHGSLILNVLAGSVEVTFVGDDGEVGSAILPAGTDVTFQPETFTFVAAESNEQPVEILVDGTVFSIDPGQTASLRTVSINILAEAFNVDSNGMLTVIINEGGTFSGSGSFTDPGADTWTATVDYGDGSGAQPLALSGKAFNLSHVYVDDGAYTVTVTVTDDDNSVGSETLLVTVNNVIPVVNAGGDTAINEGGIFSGSGSFTDPGADTWTATVDYGDGSGAQPLALSGKAYNLSHVYIDDGAYTVTVTVTDDDSGVGSDTLLVTVHNVAPTATANYYPTAQAIAVSGNVIIDNTGNGADSDPAGANDPLVVSSYTSPANGVLMLNPNGSFSYTPDSTFAGSDSFTYTISDGDGGFAPATVTINVQAPGVGSIITIPDTCLGGTALLITGTSANDTIVVEPGSTTSTLKVTFNGVSSTVTKPSGRILVTGGAGDDNIQIDGAVTNPAWLYGDAGNDRLNAGNGGGLLIGGDGNDELLGGGGRDVMIGGQGADRLIGNANDDILVAGLTTKDNRASAAHEEFWCQVLAEWNSGRSFTTRVSNLKSKLLPEVVDDCFADEIDFLNGAAGNDWLIFMAGEDKVAGQAEASN